MTARITGGGALLVLAIRTAVLCLGPSESALGAPTFIVNSTASTPDAVPGDGICDDGLGSCTLPAAVAEAVSVPTCQEPVDIHFSVSGEIAAGIEYHFAAGSPCTNPSLSIIGPGADSLILRGGVSASGYAYDYQPPYCPPACQVKTFLGLQGVRVSGELHFNEAAASLANVIADDPIEAAGSPPLTITGSSVGSVSNSGYGPYPGRPFGGITVVDSTTGHISSHNGRVSLTRVHVFGGVSLGGDPGVSTGADAEDSLIEDSQGWGIGVVGSLRVVRTTVRNNRRGGVGVGYNAAAFPSLSIEDSTISGNSGEGVGAFYGCRATIVRSTITGNQGAGTVAYPPSGTISISDSIVAGNTGTAGGAPLDCACNIAAGGGPITANRSLIGSANCSTITPDGNLIGVDPLLGPLADNGGLTPTHALLAGSPAIDAAGACAGTDQRGVPRPQGAACDMGAFEFACGNGAVDLGEQCDDGTPGDGDCCSPNCIFEGAGTSCPDDGEPCTADFCDGSGTCAHDFPVDAGCHEPVPRGAILAINDSDTDRSDRFNWTWRGATDLAEFGNPAAPTELTLCVADAAGNLSLSATVPAGGLCAGRNCWRSTKAGYRYVDPDGASEGIESVMLRASPAGSGRIKVKGRGESLQLGGLPLVLPVTARLLRSDAPTCWESRYLSATRNAAGVLRAKTP